MRSHLFSRAPWDVVGISALVLGSLLVLGATLEKPKSAR
jgi:hypothetical protein